MRRLVLFGYRWFAAARLARAAGGDRFDFDGSGDGDVQRLTRVQDGLIGS
ncbi:MAG: hypothetical protein ACYSVY_01765 [Planctomycetota bacterium]